MKFRLKAASGAQTGQTFELGERTRIGSAPEVDIRIEGLASEHAVIVALDDGLVIEASADTRVNGESVSRRALQSGDELRFGTAGFVLQAPGLKPVRVLDQTRNRSSAAWKWLVATGLMAGAAGLSWWFLYGSGAGL
ncbi:MAG: FHA domain-containing protein [Xanthomonadaceae bacterium]|nr:FHA domain-containing protein [Xanthomonadaceae bacterium]